MGYLPKKGVRAIYPILRHEGRLFVATGATASDQESGLDCKLFEELNPTDRENPRKFWLRTDGVRLAWCEQDWLDDVADLDRADEECGEEFGGESGEA